ncbi:MAG: carbohydrate-binding domain-containing protein [Eubacterium sp.]|nr:carbohydrate-binding domain-containing protein [Eubacterium sp.]
MSSSKHIDIICVVVLVLTLLITVLFMNGEKFGITPITNGDEENGQFTANDLNADWDRSDATKITLTGDGGSVSGDGAYIIDGDVYIAYAGKYVLSGELSNGSVIVEANAKDKIWILLDNVSLNCNDSAAILVKQAEKVFLTLADGTENTVSSGAEYAKEAVSLGIDGAIYSKDDLTINGSGSLTVSAEYKHGIVCNDDLVAVGGNIEITAAQDGIHANDSARFADVDITISAGDDGITVSNDDETAYIYIESGNITIPSCYEGIESIDITIAGGTINITPTDDGINANGRGNNSVIRITDGDITIINPTGRDADGLDSNGDIYISGGKLFISVNGDGTNCAIDFGSESGGICEINGGTIIAAGSSMMLEAPASSSKQGFIMHNSSTASAGTVVALENSAGKVLLSEIIPCSFSSVIISSPELNIGETYTVSVGDTQTDITVDNSSASKGGFGMGGMFGGGKQDKFPNGQPDWDNANGDDFQPGNAPEMPSGGMPNGGMPNGEISSGGIPNGGMPNGDGSPQNGFKPGGGFKGDGYNKGKFPDEHGGDDDHKMPFGQNDHEPSDTLSKSANISPNTFILIAISALLLIAGIIIALKVRH